MDSPQIAGPQKAGVSVQRPFETSWPLWVEHLGMPVWITSGDGTIIHLNARAERLLGRERDACVGARCYSVIKGTSVTGTPLCTSRCRLRATAERAGELSPITVRIHRDDGEAVDLRLVVIPNNNPITGEVQLIHCVASQNDEDRAQDYIHRIAGRSDSAALSSNALLERLTPRENQVLALLAEDMALQEIANELCVSYATVRNHVQHTLRKLGVHSILEAVAVYVLREE